MERYIPVVPEYADKYLRYEKTHNRGALALACGAEYKKYKAWKERYSRKHKYALKHGWIVQE